VTKYCHYYQVEESDPQKGEIEQKSPSMNSEVSEPQKRQIDQKSPSMNREVCDQILVREYRSESGYQRGGGSS
jgi:hypothetical protein